MSTYSIVSSFYKLKELTESPMGFSKEEFIRNNINDDLLMYILSKLLDPSVVFGLRKLQPIGAKSEEIPTFQNFTKWVSILEDNNNTKSTIEALNRFISAFPEDLQLTVQKFFCKTLKVGITAKTLNKITPIIEEFYCMLAESENKLSDIEYPVIVDVKYDGVRCLAFVKDGECTLKTRKGNTIKIPDIENEFIRLAKGADLVFESELITATRTDVSGKINSILKTGYTDEKGYGIVAKVFDVIDYDIFMDKGLSCTQQVRLFTLEQLFANSRPFNRLQMAIGVLIYSEDALKAYIKSIIDLGEEGVIVKIPKGVYEYKRSSNWIKVKAINSTTMVVVGIAEGTNKREGKVGALLCESQDGLIKVAVGSGLTDKDVSEIDDSVIGKYVEVLFNVLIKNDNHLSLFLPRLKKNDWLRIDKTEADTLNKILQEHIGKPMI